MDRETDFYVHLSSDTKSDFRNRHNLFRIKLAVPLNLKTGHWKVALTQISYPFDWNNMEISGARMTIIHKIGDGNKNLENFDTEESLVPFSRYLNPRYGYSERDLGKWVKTTIPLRFGYYPNAASIADCIVKDFKHKVDDTANKNLPFEFDSNNDGDLVSFRGASGFLFTNAAKWLEKFQPQPLFDLGECNFSYAHTDCTASLDVINSIYVYSSIVEHNLVGNVEVPLLTVVPVEGTHGTQVTYTPLRPEYKTVSQDYINDIEMQLNRSNGKEIPFIRGVVRVVLHFKRVGIDI